MAGQFGGRRAHRGPAHLSATWVIVAAVVLAALICLALLSWFGRIS